MSKQLEALQAALDQHNISKAPQVGSQNGEHADDGDDEQTEAERKERFGESS